MFAQIARRVLGILLVTLGCILSPAILLLNLNPFVLMFQTEIVVENGSSETVWFTPLGLTQGRGSLRPLPRYSWSVPAVPSVKLGGYRLAPGESQTIVYDWDDIIFTRILVEVSDGERREVIVDPDAKVEDCCYQPRQSHFVIGSIAELPVAEPDAVEAASTHSRNLGALVLHAPLLGPVILLLGLLLWRSSARQERSESRASVGRSARYEPPP